MGFIFPRVGPQNVYFFLCSTPFQTKGNFRYPLTKETIPYINILLNKGSSKPVIDHMKYSLEDILRHTICDCWEKQKRIGKRVRIPSPPSGHGLKYSKIKTANQRHVFFLMVNITLGGFMPASGDQPKQNHITRNSRPCPASSPHGAGR